MMCIKEVGKMTAQTWNADELDGEEVQITLKKDGREYVEKFPADKTLREALKEMATEYNVSYFEVFKDSDESRVDNNMSSSKIGVVGDITLIPKAVAACE